MENKILIKNKIILIKMRMSKNITFKINKIINIVKNIFWKLKKKSTIKTNYKKNQIFLTTQLPKISTKHFQL